jgi:hypothetical protein
MKLCAVYKSSKKADTYLYVAHKDDFSKVPEPLVKAFGAPKFLMIIPVAKRDTIAQLPREEFIEKLSHEGFYLHLPAKTESLLEHHRLQLGLDAKS